MLGVGFRAGGHEPDHPFDETVSKSVRVQEVATDVGADGSAVFYQVANAVELAGVDVIIVHRLVKNSIAAREYILLTDAAERDLPMNLAPITATIEEYEEIGRCTSLRMRLALGAIGLDWTADAETGGRGVSGAKSDHPIVFEFHWRDRR